MSGIAAFLDRTDAADGDTGAARRRVEAMIEALRHRGPDDRACRAAGPAVLGQCMLETTPEDGLSRQPLRAPSRNHWIVADARIDNRQDLAAHCAAGVHERLDQLSDAALILEAYARWGRECPGKLLGDFAFVIWDGERQLLFCARDQIGMRPLVYHATEQAFRCASEIKALFTDPEIERRPHWLSMALFACLAYAENGQTMYEDVHALPGGHTLTVTSSSLRIERYWEPDPWRRWYGASDEDYASRLREVLGDAVRCRLRSNRPVAVLLSGGLDSSSVAAETRRLQRSGVGPAEDPTLIHITYPGLECSETRFAHSVADRLDLPLELVSAYTDPGSLEPHVDEAHPDLHFSPTVWCQLPTLRAAVDRGIRVTLTGNGGDQVLCETSAELGADLRAGRLGKVARQTGLAREPWARSSWAGLVQAAKHLIPRRTRAAMRPLLPLLPRRQPPLPWITPQAWKAVMDHGYAPLRNGHRDGQPDDVSAALCGMLDGYSGKYCSIQWDLMAASAGAEYRHPFYDIRVVELLLAMPHEQRVIPGLEKPKPVLRRAMQGRLPDEVLTRPWASDMTCYLVQALNRHPVMLDGLLADSRLAEAGILDPGVARRMLTDESGPQEERRDLLKVAALELWLRHVTT